MVIQTAREPSQEIKKERQRKLQSGVFHRLPSNSCVNKQVCVCV